MAKINVTSDGKPERVKVVRPKGTYTLFVRDMPLQVRQYLDMHQARHMIKYDKQAVTELIEAGYKALNGEIK